MEICQHCKQEIPDSTRINLTLNLQGLKVFGTKEEMAAELMQALQERIDEFDPVMFNVEYDEQ